MKILVIVGNIRLAERIAYYLSPFCATDIATTGSEGIQKAKAFSYEAIIVDLTVSDMVGCILCKELRDANIISPILVLSHLTDTRTKIAIFDSGADGYIIKPVKPEELTAHLKALVRRRNNGYGRHVITLGDTVIDINSREVVRANMPIPLRRKEFDILECLILNKGKVVSRQSIQLYIETHSTTKAKQHGSNTVDVHIRHLRAKLDLPGMSSLVKTVYGVGYIIEEPPANLPPLSQLATETMTGVALLDTA